MDVSLFRMHPGRKLFQRSPECLIIVSADYFPVPDEKERSFGGRLNPPVAGVCRSDRRCDAVVLSGVSRGAGRKNGEGFGVKTGATKECEKIEEYKQNGWTLLNKAKGGGLGQIGNGWVTYKKCMDTARKYEYVQDFLKDYPYMYDKMRWHGWIKECTWFKYRNAKDGTYSKASKEEIAKIASKFKTRNEFQLGAKQAYKVTLKHGWMDDFFPR